MVVPVLIPHTPAEDLNHSRPGDPTVHLSQEEPGTPGRPVRTEVMAVFHRSSSNR